MLNFQFCVPCKILPSTQFCVPYEFLPPFMLNFQFYQILNFVYPLIIKLYLPNHHIFQNSTLQKRTEVAFFYQIFGKILYFTECSEQFLSSDVFFPGLFFCIFGVFLAPPQKTGTNFLELAKYATCNYNNHH